MNAPDRSVKYFPFMNLYHHPELPTSAVLDENRDARLLRDERPWSDVV